MWVTKKVKKRAPGRREKKKKKHVNNCVSRWAACACGCVCVCVCVSACECCVACRFVVSRAVLRVAPVAVWPAPYVDYYYLHTIAM